MPFAVVDEPLVALLHEAINAVGEAEPRLRARLTAVLATELVYGADPAGRGALSANALRSARQLDDPVTLSRVIASHMRMITRPETLPERLALGAELVALAEDLDDPELRFRAHSLRYFTALENIDAEHAQAELAAARRIAEELPQLRFGFEMAWFDANQALIAGRLDDAQRLAGDAEHLGRQAGVPDPFPRVVRTAILIHTRRAQGRLGEMEADVRRFAQPTQETGGWWAVLALVFAETGRTEEALAILRRAADADFESIPRDLRWQSVMAAFLHVAVLCCARDCVAEVYRLLRPYRGRLGMNGIVMTGPLDLPMAGAAMLLGDHHAALDHALKATEVAGRLRAPAWLALCQLQHARVLATLPGASRVKQADELVAAAIRDARELGLPGVEAHATALQVTLRA